MEINLLIWWIWNRWDDFEKMYKTDDLIEVEKINFILTEVRDWLKSAQ